MNIGSSKISIANFEDIAQKYIKLPNALFFLLFDELQIYQFVKILHCHINSNFLRLLICIVLKFFILFLYNSNTTISFYNKVIDHMIRPNFKIWK